MRFHNRSIEEKHKNSRFRTLALMYAPDDTPRSATNLLKRWIYHNKALYDCLKKTGWRSCNRSLTPLQRELIIQYLGEP